MRKESAAIRSTILRLFLFNGNQALNVTRISTKVKKTGAQSLRPGGVAKTSVCHRQVRRICNELKDKGYLESEKLMPPRSGRATSHYRLSEEDHNHARRTIAMLLEISPRDLLQSEYLLRDLDDIIAQRTKEIVQTNIEPDEKSRMIESLTVSPGALSRFLDPELETKLHRVASVYNDGAPIVKTLIDYVEAARLLDVADANWLP